MLLYKEKSSGDIISISTIVVLYKVLAQQEMGGSSRSRWDHFRFHLHTVPCLLFGCFMLLIQFNKCSSLNLEGLSLLEFRASVDSDPYGVFTNWSSNDNDPCVWSGVHCVDGKVQMLNLKGLDLEGRLSPELGKLTHLRSLILYKNHFSGLIPREIGGLIMLELLDLRDNNLSGTIPAEISQLSSLKRLLLCDNKFQGSIPSEVGKLNMLLEIQFDDQLTFAVTPTIRCLKKFGHCIWQRNPNQPKKAGSFSFLIKAKLLRYLDILPMFNFKDSFPGNGVNCCDELPSSAEPYMAQNVHHVINFVRRRLLQESSNLAAAPASGGPLPEQTTSVISTRSSGSFPAIPKSRMKQHVPSPNSASLTKPTDQQPFSVGSFGHKWKYVFVVPVLVFLIIVVATMILMSQSKGVKSIGPWKTGISGQLQKAFITGVPKLNRSELETACEDFSNIIQTLPHYTVYKGTLSSGVEIAVVSSVVSASQDWSPGYEVLYRKKIDTLSRLNHKNFVNLLGYCEEEEPFMRMMVFEYAPNGSLSEHLHVKEVEFLDWSARMRIIMGISYCLQYMHHELNPPVAHPSIRSSVVYLTDDYAAKLAEIHFWADFSVKVGVASKDELQQLGDPETNVYSFGILLLEIISGKAPYSEDGSLEDWVVEYLKDKQSINIMIDPMLKSIKNNELDIIKEVIEDCVIEDPKQRPTMREVTAKLRDEIAISPDAATPRLSPLWWAELEILSVEAT